MSLKNKIASRCGMACVQTFHPKRRRPLPPETKEVSPPFRVERSARRLLWDVLPCVQTRKFEKILGEFESLCFAKVLSNRHFLNIAPMPTKQWLQVEVDNEMVMHLLLSLISNFDFKPLLIRAYI